MVATMYVLLAVFVWIAGAFVLAVLSAFRAKWWQSLAWPITVPCVIVLLMCGIAGMNEE